MAVTPNSVSTDLAKDRDTTALFEASSPTEEAVSNHHRKSRESQCSPEPTEKTVTCYKANNTARNLLIVLLRCIRLPSVRVQLTVVDTTQEGCGAFLCPDSSLLLSIPSAAQNPLACNPPFQERSDRTLSLTASQGALGLLTGSQGEGSPSTASSRN